MTELPEREPVVERREYVDVTPDYEEHVIQDVSTENRQILSRVTQLIWLVAIIIEAAIAIRIFLKLIAASPASAFARLVYGFTDIFLFPFFGLTATPAAGGMVLEVPSIIAMIVYALFFWVAVKLLWILLEPSRSRTVVTTYNRE
jgi:hypothetical protein